MDHLLINIKSYLNKSKSPNKSTKHNYNLKQQFSNTFNDDCIRYEEVAEIAKYLQSKVSIKPTIGIICGSGLGGLADLISDAQTIEYKDIPHFPVSTVAGHAGALVFGNFQNVPIVCMKGRIHTYEGYTLSKCTLPIRVMKLLGVEILIVTNAAGGLNEEFNVGDIMLFKDHIFFPGFSGNNPLRGQNDSRFGLRFLDMYNCYDRKLMKIAEEAAKKLRLTKYMRKGVYAMLGGPNYETVAEAKFLRNCGVDAVGMSTVHEVIVAHHSGIRVIGFSLITNKITTDYDSNGKANHEEILEAAKKRSKDFENLIQEFVSNIGKEQNG